MQAAFTEANLEAHDFRLSFAAAVVRSFALKRQERVNAARTLLAQSDSVVKGNHGIPNTAGVAPTRDMSQNRDAVLASNTPYSSTHQCVDVSTGSTI